jgi:FHS family L-fucose permease-like MFS transporter
MQKIAANKVLGFNAFAAIAFILVAILTSGSIAMWAILLVGLFNSIMFPTIFSLALTGVGKCTSQGSGLLCLAIVGGAILPLIQGVLADFLSVQLSFFFPIICYCFIAYYAFFGSKLRTNP